MTIATENYTSNKKYIIANDKNVNTGTGRVGEISHDQPIRPARHIKKYVYKSFFAKRNSLATC